MLTGLALSLMFLLNKINSYFFLNSKILGKRTMKITKTSNSLIFREIKLKNDLEKLQTLIDIIFDNTYFNMYGILFKEEQITGKQYLVFDGKKIVGIFVFSTDLDAKIATIDLLGVLPEYRNHKYGSFILHSGLKTIKQYNPSIIKVLVEVIADDIHLSNFYIKNGYSIDRIEYYAFDTQGRNLCSGKLMDLNNAIIENSISHLIVWNFLKISI